MGSFFPDKNNVPSKHRRFENGSYFWSWFLKSHINCVSSKFSNQSRTKLALPTIALHPHLHACHGGFLLTPNPNDFSRIPFNRVRACSVRNTVSNGLNNKSQKLLVRKIGLWFWAHTCALPSEHTGGIEVQKSLHGSVFPVSSFRNQSLVV